MDLHHILLTGLPANLGVVSHGEAIELYSRSLHGHLRRAGRCWGKSQKSGRMAHFLHLPLELGEAPLCMSNCNSSFVTMRVMKKPSPMSSPSTKSTNASNISG